LLVGTCRLCGSWSVAGHNHRKTIFVRICTCPETVEQILCVTREIETCLLDSTASYNRVVDHRSRRPVRSALRSCIDRCHVYSVFVVVVFGPFDLAIIYL